MMQLEFYQRSVVSYKQWKCLNETVAVWLQQVFIDIDAEDFVDFFAARVTSQNVASRTIKKLKKRKDGLGLCSLYLYTWISWESHKNLVRISWESREKLMRPLHSHENLVRKFQPRENLMRISREFSASINLHIQSFHEKTPKYAHENLVTFSWDSHEKAFQFSREKKTHENLMRNSWEISREAHESWKISWENVPIFTWKRKSREILMRFGEKLMRFSWESLTIFIFSWESHEILMSTHENFCKGRCHVLPHLPSHACTTYLIHLKLSTNCTNSSNVFVCT